MTVKFKAMNGAHLSDKQAQIYGERIDEMVKKTGSITPSLVLKDAKNPQSPLHDYFEWDDTIAAEKWRTKQAHYLIQSIVIEVVNDDGKKDDIRYFFNVAADDSTSAEPKSVYVNIGTIMNDKEKRGEVIAHAKAELVGWTKRYGQYSELKQLTRFIRNHT